MTATSIGCPCVCSLSSHFDSGAAWSSANPWLGLIQGQPFVVLEPYAREDRGLRAAGSFFTVAGLVLVRLAIDAADTPAEESCTYEAMQSTVKSSARWSFYITYCTIRQTVVP
ncbi:MULTISPECIES: hypothetical protein [unclassified Rathayibacter]|uniref:hypothetical protein n=1 Tax=unclassified Rathayibacter TaxID=2609250 RepID=UPI0011B0A1E5|nr:MULTISPECIES: hypothetical protein [unclassified Rathayibacter]